jgi:hypothetical protein
MRLSSVLTWIEQSSLGHFVRESGPWTYPVINLAHILGIATLFGSVLVMDLTLLGVGRAQPWARAAVASAAAPIARAGFLLAAASGLGLVSANGSEYTGNPFFMIKFPIIALGLLNAAVITRSAAWRALRAGEPSRPDQRRLALLAGTSLVCWSGAVAAGRMIGYW